MTKHDLNCLSTQLSVKTIHAPSHAQAYHACAFQISTYLYNLKPLRYDYYPLPPLTPSFSCSFILRDWHRSKVLCYAAFLAEFTPNNTRYLSSYVSDIKFNALLLFCVLSPPPPRGPTRISLSFSNQLLPPVKRRLESTLFSPTTTRWATPLSTPWVMLAGSRIASQTKDERVSERAPLIARARCDSEWRSPYLFFFVNPPTTNYPPLHIP